LLGRGALTGHGLPPRDRAANHMSPRGGVASVSCWDAGIRTKISSSLGEEQLVLGAWVAVKPLKLSRALE
jgi:hypothetical protein